MKEFEEIGLRRGELKSIVGERNKVLMEFKKVKGRCLVCGRELIEEYRKEFFEKYMVELKEIFVEMKEFEKREKKFRVEFVEVEKMLKKERELFVFKEVFE